jgi:putative ABC transport system permease protein
MKDQRSFEPIDRFCRDLRHVCRSLRRSPAYAAAAILTLALGIGANTAVFSALNGVVLEPLPYPKPDRLVIVALYNLMLKSLTYLSYPDFLDWQREAGSFKQIAALTPLRGFDLTNPGEPEHVNGYDVSANFFSTLGVELALGRSFSPGDDRMGGAPSAVISDRLWRERFHGAPSVIGKPLTLNGSDYFITGVLPPGFRFENQAADVYTPVGRSDSLFRRDRTVHDILCVGRLKDGVSIGQAQAEMNTVQTRMDELNPATEKSLLTYVVSLKKALVGDAGGTLFLLLVAVGFVLLIASANVANLLLARSAARAREFALRRALGASRMQIVRQLITESMLLSLAGGAGGLLVAKFGLTAALRAGAGSLPRIEDIGISTTVLWFALFLSIAVGILFALVPGLKYAGSDSQMDLREGGRGATTRHQSAQNSLATAQIALAFVLLSGAGLLLRTIHNLWAVYPGFDAQRVITFQVGFSPLAVGTGSATRAVFQQLRERIRQAPGVEAADITALVPLGRGDNSGPFWIGKHQPSSMAEIPRATWYPTGPDYPRAMQIPLLQGRFLTDADNSQSELVVLIDSRLAHAYFPGSSPLGQTLTIPHWGSASAVIARVVGVVGHVEQYGIDGSGREQPQIYYSLYQLPDEALSIFRNDVTFAVRTRIAPAAVMPGIRNVVHEAIGDQPVYNIRSMPELVAGSMARQRFPMLLLVAFSAVALLLACVGIYGVISYSVAQRVPEVGIRMALGAAKWDVLRMMLREGLRMAAAGVAIGACGAVVLTRLLPGFSHLLYEVRATDPWTLLAVVLCLMLAALSACLIPASRAARLDPMTALRHE